MGFTGRTSFDAFEEQPAAVNLLGGGSVCVRIPASAIRFLMGALEPLRWPEAWSGTAEEVVLASAQMDNVIGALAEAVDCERTIYIEVPGENGNAGGGAGACLIGEDFLTMTIGLIADIEWRGDELWIRRVPCCDWERVGEGPGRGGDPEIPEENEPGEGFSTCGRAAAISALVEGVAHALYTQTAAGVLAAVGNVYLQFPWLSGGQTHFIAAHYHVAAIGFADVLFGVDFGTTLDFQTYRCRLEEYMDETDQVLSDDEWQAVESVAHAVLADNALMRSFWTRIIAGIGRGDMSAAAVAGSDNHDADCSCPGESLDPTDNWPPYLSWTRWADLRNGVPDWLQLAGESQYDPLYGVTDLPSETGYMKASVRTDAIAWPALCDIEFLYIKWKPVAGVSYEGNEVRIFPSEGTQFFAGDGPDTDPSAGGVHVVSQIADYSPSETSEYVQWDVEMRSPNGSQAAYAVYILEIGIGGTGEDPFA